MKNQVKSIIAYFLILCITVSIIPLNLLHHHDEDQIVCENLPADEDNPCHQAVAHEGFPVGFECEHKTHLDKDVEHCEFCELLTTRHYTGVPVSLEWLAPNHEMRDLVVFTPVFKPLPLSGEITNKGPPTACVSTLPVEIYTLDYITLPIPI